MSIGSAVPGRLPTPYYQHNGITIYHADCREVLPLLEPGSVDLVLTDPPYGVRWVSGQRRIEFGPIVGDDSQDAAVEGIRLSLHCLRRHRHVYAFGRYEGFDSLPLAGCVELIWDKEMFTAGDTECVWAKGHEYIQFGAYAPAPLDARRHSKAARLRRGSVLRCLRQNGLAVQHHPTEKPVEILRQLIEASSLFGEVVLDPFMGSGSTLIAARSELRCAIGIEIEERYCEIAARRLSQEVLPL